MAAATMVTLSRFAKWLTATHACRWARDHVNCIGTWRSLSIAISMSYSIEKGPHLL